MDKLKLEIMRKVLMLDTKAELEIVKENVSDAISREMDLEDNEQEEFKKWKAEKNSKEIPF